MTILEAEKLLPVVVPSGCFFPEFSRGCDRQQQFLRAGSVHLLSNDLLDFADHAETEWKIGIDAGCYLSDQSGTQHQSVADGFRFAGIVPQRGDE